MRIAARLVACLIVLLALSACARDALKPAAVMPPGPPPTERLAVADRLVRAGCLDCLLEAYREYQALRAIPSAGRAATMGAIRAAGLIALRQRELGMADEGYLAAAKELSSSTTNLPAWIERAERDYTEQIATIRASSEPEDRKARKIAKREQLIANGRRQMATSWFNIAVASYNLTCRARPKRDSTPRRSPTMSSSVNAPGRSWRAWAGEGGILGGCLCQ
jgi:hypothetical protein